MLIRTKMKGSMDTKEEEESLGQGLEANDENPWLRSSR
jgi:hypothetical protein